MKLKILFSLFLIFTTTKLLLIPTINSPHIVFDESILFVESQLIWHNYTYFTERWLGFPQYPPLYPLLISPTAIFNDVTQSFKAILVINCFISTAVIFPTYYLAKEYLAEREIWFVVILVGILPASFIYSYSIMSENLFIPLFLGSVYFLKRVLDKDNFKNNALVGLFISLTVLTKMIGVVLIGVYVLIKIFLYIKNKYVSVEEVKNHV